MEERSAVVEEGLMHVEIELAGMKGTFAAIEKRFVEIEAIMEKGTERMQNRLADVRNRVDSQVSVWQK